MPSPSPLDRLSLILLRFLQEDCTQSQELLKEKLKRHHQIDISSATISRKISALQEYIIAHRAVIDKDKLGLGQAVIVLLKLKINNRKELDKFEALINTKFTNIIESMTCAGDWDYVLKIIGPDLKFCEKIIEQIRCEPNIEKTYMMPVSGEIENNPDLTIWLQRGRSVD